MAGDHVAEVVLIVSLSAIFLATVLVVLCILCWNKIKVNDFRFPRSQDWLLMFALLCFTTDKLVSYQQTFQSYHFLPVVISP